MARLHHSEKVLEAAQSESAAARSPIAASWRRSLLLHRLTPDSDTERARVTEAEFRVARERLSRLIAVANPTLDRLFQSVGGTGCCVLLTDFEGLVVEGRVSEGYGKTFDRWGLCRGAVWSESAEGTNGIGTCLVEKRPVAIHRDQHFRSSNTAMSCMDAPIFGPDGRLIAALDVSSCRADLTEGFAQLISTAVIDAARQIESDHFLAAFQSSCPGARVVVGAKHGPAGAVLLAVDRDDLVIGATAAARKLYGLTDEMLANPRPAADILAAPEGGDAPEGGGLEAAERSELRRALARSGGNVSAAARSLGIGRATFYRRMERLGLA